MKRYAYVIRFRSEVNDTLKQQIISKLQAEIGPYVASGTIEASNEAIEIQTIDVGEFHPLYNEP